MRKLRQMTDLDGVLVKLSLLLQELHVLLGDLVLAPGVSHLQKSESGKFITTLTQLCCTR